MTFKKEAVGQHLELRKGLSYKGSNLVDESEVGLLTIDAFITGGGYKRGSAKPYAGEYRLEHIAEPGHVLLAMTEQQEGLLASPLKVPEDADGMGELVFSLDVAKVIATSGAVTPEFFFNFLRVPINRRRAAYGDTGTTVQRLPYDVIYEQAIPVPTLDEQGRINSFIALLDRKIELNAAIAANLERIAQSTFRSWFVDFDPVKAKMAGEKPVGMDEATAVLFPDSMEDSELGKIPTGWAVKPLFDFKLEIESGSRPKGGVKGISTGIPSIGAESINGIGVFDFSKTKYVSEEFYSKMNKGKPRDFDVLLYKDGGKPGVFKPRVGMYGLGFPFSKYAINEHVFLLRSAELGPAFTYFWIRMERTLDVLRNRGIKAAIPGINQQDVGTLPVLWSSYELITKFNELCMPHLELILNLAAQSLELSNLRDLLLPRLISGELQIPKEMLAS